MKIRKSTVIKSYAYLKDQLDLARKKDDNESVVNYYERTIEQLLTRYYSQ